MKTTIFSVPSLDEQRFALDLANSLVGITGVGGINTDVLTHTVTVEHDPNLVSDGMMHSCIEGTGYPVTGSSAA